MFLERVRDFLNPAYHIRQFVEDMRLMRKALLDRKAFETDHDMESLAKVFRGRLFSAFFITGSSGLIAAALAYAIQRYFDNPWIGLFATILFGIVVTSLAYQIFWFIDNKGLYQKNGHQTIGSLVEMQRDLWPVHFMGIKTGLTFLILTTPVNGLIIGLIEFFNRKFAAVLPVPVIMYVVDLILVQGAFLRLMGDFFDRYSKVLAKKYAALFAVTNAA